MRLLLVLTFAAVLGLAAQKQPVTSTNEANRTTESSRERVITGRLVDANCKAPASACPVNSGTTEFGMILPDGKFAKFDAGGQEKVKDALEHSRKGKKILRASPGKGKSPKVRVGGTLTDWTTFPSDCTASYVAPFGSPVLIWG